MAEEQASRLQQELAFLCIDNPAQTQQQQVEYQQLQLQQSHEQAARLDLSRALELKEEQER